MRTTLKVIGNLPKLLLLSVLLIFFFLLEGFIMIIYFAVESPFHFLLSKLEIIIKSITKELT